MKHWEARFLMVFFKCVNWTVSFLKKIKKRFFEDGFSGSTVTTVSSLCQQKKDIEEKTRSEAHPVY